MRAFSVLLAFVVAVSTVGAVCVWADEGATASPHATTGGVDAAPPRSVAILDVVSDNRSNRSGVHPVDPGSTLLVRGTTDRRPDDNAIDLSVTAGPDADRFGFVVVESWGYDGRWTARLAVPAAVTPGMYTLEVQVDGDADVQRFEVAERRPATLGRASLSDTVRPVSGERVRPFQVAVENVTLSNGGYVEVRDGGTSVGRSSYLTPGTHAIVIVGVSVNGNSDLRAVAVRGTPDRVDDPYRSNDSAVAVPVPLRRGGVPPSPTPTPTDATAPGVGTPATMIALVLSAVALLLRARNR